MHSIRFVAAVLLASFVFLLPTRAEAFPWMVKHAYNNCGTCHVDPSGAGLLTEYGRAQSSILLSTFGGGEGDDPGRFKDFLFGAFSLPSDPDKGALNLGAFVREAFLSTNGGGQTLNLALYMQQEVDAHFQYKRLHAYGALGYSPSSAQAFAGETWVTDNAPTSTNPNDFAPGNLVAPLYWLGYDVADGIMIRAGRLNLPFGIRDPNHFLWVRSETRTSYNQDQQVGATVSVNTEKVRAELMGIAGNYQINPDALRERGYAGYLEWDPASGYGFGVSSLLTYANANLTSGANTGTTRQAHGLFARFSPWKPLAVTAEGDVLIKSPQLNNSALGYVGMIQPDFEIVRGVHAMVTGEILQNSYVITGTNPAGRVWLTAEWFVCSHVDLRFDVYRQMQSGQSDQMAYLLQAHLYL